MLAERLGALGVSDPSLRWNDLGEYDLAEVQALPDELIGRFTETLLESWATIATQVRQDALLAAIARLPEVQDPLVFLATADRLTSAAIAAGDESAWALQETYAAVLAIATSGQAGTTAFDTRPRFALGAWVDLVCADAVPRYQLMARLDQFRHGLPTFMAAPVARAAGRLDEIAADALFSDILEAALAIPEATGDAAVELGHRAVRAAASAQNREEALTELRSALALYEGAGDADEARSDARAYSAAVELTLAFIAGAAPKQLAESGDRLTRAALALRADDEDAASRSLRQVGAWLTFGADVRNAADQMTGTGMLDLRTALTLLLDLYADARIRLLGDGATSPDLQILIGPRIENWVTEVSLSPDTLQAFADELPENSPLRQPLSRLRDVMVNPGKARRSRCLPGSPGGWALDSSRRTTRRARPKL